MSYQTAAGSRTSHKSAVSAACHYFKRIVVIVKDTMTKPRDCSVCDECQRLEKLARQEVKA
jgi:predicted PilT family ATPase